MYKVFDDRHDAGRALIERVKRCELDQPIVLALPRGGVPVAYEIAKALEAPLDTVVVRKLRAPMQPELAIGAIASGGIRVLNEELVGTHLGLDEAAVEAITQEELQELRWRERRYRGDRPFPDLAGRDVLLVDDGMATGATMRAAAEAVREHKPSKIVVAVPTGSKSAVAEVSKLVDQVICLVSPAEFYAVGQFYRNFAQTSDEEVREYLDQAHEAFAGC